MVRSTLESATVRKPVHSVYIKIIANHMQVIGAIANIDYHWPTQIQSMQDGQQEVSSQPDRVFSFDCFLMGKLSGVLDFPVYYYKLFIFGILPILFAVIDFLVWFVICTYYGRNYSQFLSKFTSTLVVLLFLVHPNIAQTMFLAFNCLEVDGVFRLKQNISSICYQDEHLFFLEIIVIPSIIFWVIGIPMFSVFLLYRNRETLKLMGNRRVTVA
jgi:hypothetical protein